MLLLLPAELILSIALYVCALRGAHAAESPSEDGDLDGPVAAWDDYQHFKTEPTFRAHRVVIKQQTSDASLLQPGYIFFATFPAPHDPVTGPQIIDQQATIDDSQQLVWDGIDTQDARVQDFGPCNYMGGVLTHLCWSENDFTPSIGSRAWDRIFDNTYTPVRRPYGAAVGRLGAPEGHEFHTTRNGTSFVMSVINNVEWDLSPFGGPANGYVDDGCFQEVDIVSGRALFTWCMLDHGVQLNDTFLFHLLTTTLPSTGPNDTGGTYHNPWDYAHVNAIDKNDEGDYYVSSRHLDTIFKVAGLDNNKGLKPGTIIWRLGGKRNDFDGEEALLDLSRQHHVREISLTTERTTLTIFNNQFQERPSLRAGVSKGIVVVVNNATMAVEEVRKYPNPDGFMSLAQGSASLLENDNMFVGWGTAPYITEFAKDGTVLSHMQIGSFNPKQGIHDGIINYRAFKADWVGRPLTPPKLLAYSLDCEDKDAPLVAYVSWNGATEVRRWRFYTSQVSSRGPWLRAGVVDKDGFETRALLQGFWGGPIPYRRWVLAQALDGNDKILGKVTSETFVPEQAMRSDCDVDGCSPVKFAYPADKSCARDCAQEGVPLVFWGALLVVLAFLETAAFFAMEFFPWRSRRVGDDEAGEYSKLEA